MRALLVLALLAALVALPSSAAGQSAPGQVAAAAKKAKEKKAKRGRCARHRTRGARKRCVRRVRCLRRARNSRRARKRCLAEARRKKSPGRSPSAPGAGGGGSAPKGPDGGSTAPDGGEDTGPTLGRYVSVAAREFTLTLSRPALAAGSVTVELRNAGEDPHNLVLSPDDGSHEVVSSFEETGPGELRAKNLALPAGSYYLWCSLPAHELLGMRARLQVR